MKEEVLAVCVKDTEENKVVVKERAAVMGVGENDYHLGVYFPV